MSSFKLQKYIRNLSELDLVFYSDVDNFQINERWVTDIERDYYLKFTTGIKEILEEEFSEANNDILLSDVRNALAEAKRKALKKWEDIITGSSEVHFFSEFYSSSKPTNATLDFLVNEEQEERKKIIFDGVADLLKLDTEKFTAGKDLHSYLTSPGTSSPVKNIKFDYAFGHLFYVLSIKVELIDDLLNDLEEFVNPVNSKPMHNQNTNPYSIELNFLKKDVAIFFHTLHELDLLKTDVNDIYDSQEKLKKWIDASNIYYRSKTGEIAKVKSINRYFTSLNNKEWDGNEIKFLEDILIPKLNERLEKLKERGKK